MLDRKPRNKEFQFYSGNFKRLKLLDFFNPKSAIRNPKSCLNGLFVQALIIFSDHGFVENPAFIPTDKYETPRYVHGKDFPFEVIVPWAWIMRL